MNESFPPVSLAHAAFKGRCPRCGKGRLYKNLLDVADYCPACGLSFKAHVQGDGPASISVLFIGALTGIGASVIEVKYEPPLWVHAVVWIPLVIAGSLLALRWVKAALIALQYQYRRDDKGE